MKRWALSLILTTACTAVPPTATVDSTTVDPCVEVHALWLASYTAPDVSLPPIDDDLDLLDEMTQRGQRLRQQKALEQAARVRSVEQRAILAEQHPDGFTVQERVNAEAERRLLAE